MTRVACFRSRPWLVPLILGLGLIAGLSLRLSADAARTDKLRSAPALRRPVALALVEDGRWLCVANRRHGSLSIVDTATLRVETEIQVGRTLADLTADPQGHRLLAVDEDGN